MLTYLNLTGAVSSDVTQTHADAQDTNGNHIIRVSTTTCTHFRFFTPSNTSPYTTVAALGTPEAFAATAAVVRDVFPGVFEIPRSHLANHEPDVESTLSSTFSLPTMPSLCKGDLEEEPTTGPILGIDVASLYNCRTCAFSISTDGDVADMATTSGSPLYMTGSGLHYFNDPMASAQAVVVADPDQSFLGITRFYVVTIGRKVGIFADVYVSFSILLITSLTRHFL